MAIDALQNWKDTLAALPKVADNSWGANFAAWYADRVTGIAPDPSALVATGFVFVFPESDFATSLEGLEPKSDAVEGITGFAEAWESAISSMTYPSGISVAPGTFIPPTSPTTLFSSVTAVQIIPSSIAAGKAKIIELASAPPVDDANDSQFPVKFREATLLLKIKVDGLDSQPPPSAGPGPQALTANNVPLI